MYLKVLTAVVAASMVLAATPDPEKSVGLDYDFEVIASLGELAPGGGKFDANFQASDINNLAKCFTAPKSPRMESLLERVSSSVLRLGRQHCSPALETLRQGRTRRMGLSS